MSQSARRVIIREGPTPTSTEWVYLSNDPQAEHIYIVSGAHPDDPNPPEEIRIAESPLFKHVYVVNPEDLPAEYRPGLVAGPAAADDEETVRLEIEHDRPPPAAPVVARRSRSWGVLWLVPLVLVLVAAGYVLLSRLPVQPALSPSPTSLAALPTVPPPPSPSPSPSGSFVLVGNTGGEGVYLRRTPNLEDRLTAWPDRTRLAVIGPDTTQNGQRWKRVRAPDGQEGWVPAEFVVEPNQ